MIALGTKGCQGSLPLTAWSSSPRTQDWALAREPSPQHLGPAGTGASRARHFRSFNVGYFDGGVVTAVTEMAMSLQAPHALGPCCWQPRRRESPSGGRHLTAPLLAELVRDYDPERALLVAVT